VKDFEMTNPNYLRAIGNLTVTSPFRGYVISFQLRNSWSRSFQQEGLCSIYPISCFSLCKRSDSCQRVSWYSLSYFAYDLFI